jgi:hypothetical protein
MVRFVKYEKFFYQALATMFFLDNNLMCVQCTALYGEVGQRVGVSQG